MLRDEVLRNFNKILRKSILTTSKVTKKQDFTLSLEDTFLKKTRKGVNCPSPTFLGLKCSTKVLQLLRSKKKTFFVLLTAIKLR